MFAHKCATLICFVITVAIQHKAMASETANDTLEARPPVTQAGQFTAQKALSENTCMFTAIFSPADAPERRNHVRDMWKAAASAWGGCLVPKFAICGSQAATAGALVVEASQFGYIMILECEEGYGQGLLTRKVLAALREYEMHYSDLDYFMKTDDDTFVSARELLEYVRQYGGQNSYMGHRLASGRSASLPIRDSSNKWYEPMETYNESVYPETMAGGAGYILGRTLVQAILKLGATERNILWNEDRAVAVWIRTVQRQGVPVHFVNIPAADGNLARMFCRTWLDYPFVMHHHVDGETIKCLAKVAVRDNPQEDVGQCWHHGHQKGEVCHTEKKNNNSSLVEKYLYYMPGSNVVLCGCEKCGTTSLYNFVYEAEFGHPWPYTDFPWIQDTSSRWEGKLTRISAESARKHIAGGAYSMALARDPEQRLISSWKSKAACDSEGFVTDATDRTIFVPMLLKLQGKGFKSSCLSFEDFFQVLHDIHLAGKASYLQPHFMPQNLHCFRDIQPQEWSRVVSLGTFAADAAFADLASHLGGSAGNASVPHLHGSHGSKLSMTQRGVQQLAAVTAAEREAIAVGSIETPGGAASSFVARHSERLLGGIEAEHHGGNDDSDDDNDDDTWFPGSTTIAPAGDSYSDNDDDLWFPGSTTIAPAGGNYGGNDDDLWFLGSTTIAPAVTTTFTTHSAIAQSTCDGTTADLPTVFLGTDCPATMVEGQTCAVLCESSFTRAGFFTCSSGEMVGQSVCVEEGNIVIVKSAQKITQRMDLGIAVPEGMILAELRHMFRVTIASIFSCDPIAVQKIEVVEKTQRRLQQRQLNIAAHVFDVSYEIIVPSSQSPDAMLQTASQFTQVGSSVQQQFAETLQNQHGVAVTSVVQTATPRVFNDEMLTTVADGSVLNTEGYYATTVMPATTRLATTTLATTRLATTTLATTTLATTTLATTRLAATTLATTTLAAVAPTTSVPQRHPSPRPAVTMLASTMFAITTLMTTTPATTRLAPTTTLVTTTTVSSTVALRGSPKQMKGSTGAIAGGGGVIGVVVGSLLFVSCTSVLVVAAKLRRKSTEQNVQLNSVGSVPGCEEKEASQSSTFFL